MLALSLIAPKDYLVLEGGHLIGRIRLARERAPPSLRPDRDTPAATVEGLRHHGGIVCRTAVLPINGTTISGVRRPPARRSGRLETASLGPTEQLPLLLRLGYRLTSALLLVR